MTLITVRLQVGHPISSLRRLERKVERLHRHVFRSITFAENLHECGPTYLTACPIMSVYKAVKLLDVASSVTVSAQQCRTLCQLPVACSCATDDASYMQCFPMCPCQGVWWTCMWRVIGQDCICMALTVERCPINIQKLQAVHLVFQH